MPKFALKIRCQLENVAKMEAEPSNQWCLVVQSPDASETCEAYLTVDEEHDLAGSKGTAHFIKKWSGSNQQSYLKIIDVKNVTKGGYDVDDDQEWVAIVAFEARGLEPIGWMCRNDFAVESVGGTVFPAEEVEFDDQMWADYDGENDIPVSIQNLESVFEPC
eukprot:FR735714.1.p1 GENE.FR735714.1~~FR735714.1.p1  ORF type:complete len:162 (+),score=15.95 FR735714.1:1-486(+)